MVVTQDVQTYVDELWFFLDSFDHSFKQKKLDDLRARCRVLIERLPALPKDERLTLRFEAMRHRLAELRAALDDSSQQGQAYVRQRQLELSRSYEHWLTAYRAWVAQHGLDKARIASLKPLRHARTLFHMVMAVIGAFSYQFFLSKEGAVLLLGTLLTIFGSLEITRRIWPRWNTLLLESPIFKPIARPHEFHKVNSATYYLLALMMVTPFFSRPEVITGILILGFADPAAAWLGKTYGKRKLFGAKTLVGFVAFIVTGFVASFSFLLVFYGTLAIEQRALAAFAAAFVAGLVELCVSRIDDNLAIPLAAVSAASLFI